MYLVGIEPKAPGMHIFSQSVMPRLGLPLLLTMARNNGHNCKIYCEDIAPVNWDDVKRADMILISSLTSTAPRAYSLIKRIKDEFNSRATILIGGPHVTFLPEEALDSGADFVFRHEADESFVNFLEWWESGRDTHQLLDIAGLSFIIADKYHHTPDPRHVDLDRLPTPDLDLIQGF
jgi:anaerobic magnesium-protoporphyrin IX monomethyl ester cyclase